nr:MAG: 2-hydroxychromene-2-carboxylate isomerase [Pseudomonadota bacterium]
MQSRSETTARQIDFYFDFISPYGYLASLRIDEIGARYGIPVAWHPILIGVTVLKIMGLKPLMETPLKRDYVVREIARYCRRHGVTLGRPLDGPMMNPLPAGRAFAWMLRHAPEHARPFARAVFDAYWREGRDLSVAEELRAAARIAGVPDEMIAAALSSEEASALLRESIERAVARGVFGSPFVLVDDEPFFGVDKLELIEEWIRCNGW